MKNQIAEIHKYETIPKTHPLRVLLSTLYLLGYIKETNLNAKSIPLYCFYIIINIAVTLPQWNKMRSYFGYKMFSQMDNYNILDHLGDADAVIIEKVNSAVMTISVSTYI